MQGRHQKVSYKSKKTVWLPKSQWIVVAGTHQAIVDRETFDKVQSLLEGRARSGSNGMIHPLARKVFCGCCGSAMEQTGAGSSAAGTKRRYLRCRLHQRAPDRCGNKTCTNLDDLEEAILQRIRRYRAAWFEPEKMEFPPETDTDPIRAKQEELRRLKQEIRRRQTALEELYLDKASGLVAPELFGEMQQRFLQEAQRARVRAEGLEKELDGLDSKSGAAARKEQIRTLAGIHELTRELAALLVDRVVVWPKDPETGMQKVTIEWNF